MYNRTFVLTPQAGFALVEVGSVRMKNTKNILTKNLLDPCISALSFWIIGYAFAFGDDNRFIGEGKKKKEKEKKTVSYFKQIVLIHACDSQI
jgi:ammonia channel protein AmtB